MNSQRNGASLAGSFKVGFKILVNPSDMFNFQRYHGVLVGAKGVRAVRGITFRIAT